MTRSFAVWALLIALPVSSLADSEALLEAEKQRAAGGDAEAAHRVGRAYERGWDVRRDPMAAVEYYEIAARAGDADAQLALGLLYTGVDPAVPRDDSKSEAWLLASALQGNATAQYFIGLRFESESADESGLLQAFEWFRRASAQGDARAMLEMARLYASGRGVQLDRSRAHAWNRLALDRGAAEGGERARELEARMTPDEVERAQQTHRRLSRRVAGAPVGARD